MENNPNDSILYELFIYAEWRPDPDYIRGEISPRHSSGKSALNYSLRFFKPEQTLLEYVSNSINQLQSWQICLGDHGKVVAVLQDTMLEIRSKRGNYSTVLARASVPRDPYLKWRKMVWSPDCSMLALAHSNGKVSFFDLMATNLFNIQPDSSDQPEIESTDTTYAVAGIVFLTSRAHDHKWSSEVLLVDYRGTLRSFLVSPTDGYKYNHKFNFEGGVSTFTYHPSHNMVFVTGLSSNIRKETTSATDFGLRGWRLLNDSPFYKLSMNLDKEQPLTLMAWLPLWKNAQQSVIKKSIASPSGSLLACLHVDGAISLWQLPALKLLKHWPVVLQPNFDIQSPLILITKHKVWPSLENGYSEYSPVDINWWNDQAVIVSRLNGSVSICSIEDLHNMLGDNPEFLQGHPQISGTFDNGFLSLECEAALISAKKLRKDSESEDDNANVTNENEVGVDSSDDEKVSLMSRGTEVVKTALYIVTDMERFQPKPKKINLLSRVYRLLCLRSTTPEDLYSRKIENADYNEALSLARTYNLDCDLVYQQQWRTSKVSHESITDYLSKVSKKIWVIQQCCYRVPETLSAAKELLEYGLNLTNEEIMKDANFEIKEDSEKEDYLNNITPDILSSHNSEVLRCRHTMLFYLDQLDTYKAVIKSEFSTYSSDEYNRLRSNSLCRSAADFAREGRVQALNCLWPHLHKVSLRLYVLQNLPETLNPMEYKSLLPEFNSAEEIPTQRKSINRKPDWCENEIFSSIWRTSWSDDLDDIDGEELPLPSSNLTEWYSNRARQIEKFCGLVNYALALITLARERNVPGLEELNSLLLTLDTLVYDVNVDQMTLVRLEGCSQFQVANYLMSMSKADDVIDDLNNILFPYLERCEMLSNTPDIKQKLFNDYVVNLSVEDLTLPLVIFRGANELAMDVKQILLMADNCLMAQNTKDQLSLCFEVLEALPKESDASVAPSYLVRALDEMERFLKACSLLKLNDVFITFADLKALVKDPKEVLSLLTTMARNASKKIPKLTPHEWNDLLSDIMKLHSKVFCCIDIELCYEIYAASLLSSADKASILSACQVLTCQSNGAANVGIEPRVPLLNKVKPSPKIHVTQKVPFQRTISLVLEAAKEYFNTASSISDPLLDFSWTCLQLIKQDNAEIQYERDMILALKIIQEFELSILPVQVRTYSSKIVLIEECLNCNNKSYKAIEKLLQLAKLLRIAENDEKKREVIIVSMCADKAMEAEDIDEGRKLGKRLVQVSEEGAAVASKNAAQRLGADPRLPDLGLRRDLLNLALLHCDAQDIENLLQTRSTVEAEILQVEIQKLINLSEKFDNREINLQDSVDSIDEDFVDALSSPLNENKSIMATRVMEKYIQKPLMALSDRSTWKEALNFNWTKEKLEVVASEAKCLKDTKIACHAFYDSLQKSCHISTFSTKYDKFSTPDVLDKKILLLQSFIRNNLLQDSVNYGTSGRELVQELIQSAERMLSEDTALCISQLMTLFDLFISNQCVFNIPLNIKTIHGMLYYYALVNYIEVHQLPEEAFILPPSDLISDTIKKVETISYDKLNNSQRTLLSCRDSFIELIEGEKLILLGCDLDINLLTNDPVYRKNAIINISKTNVPDNLILAMELANKYGVDEKEIAFAHLSYVILNNESIGLPECNKLLCNPLVIKKLNSNILKRFHKDVWTELDGCHHQSLILYCTLIDNIDNHLLFKNLNAKDHIKLIKKVKSACSSINYKALLEFTSEDELVNYLQPLLNKENIGVVAKLLRNLPPCLNINFNSSSLYREWLLKYFFDCQDSNHSSKKWMQLYRECSSYFNKLKKDDMILLAKEVIFGSIGTKKLNISTRIQIANQTAEYCQHEHNNETFNFKNQQGVEEINWEDIGDEIARWGKFLELLHSELPNKIVETCTKHLPTVWNDIEYSRGVKSELLKPLKEIMCENALPTRDFLTLLSILNETVTLNDLLLYVFEDNILQTRVLVGVTKRLMDLAAQGVDISQEVLDKVKPYSNSTLLSSKQRLDLMSLQKANHDRGDMKIIEQITLEMIEHNWSPSISNDIKDCDLTDTANRSVAFMKLISDDGSWEKLKVLVDLINMWPVLTEHEDQDKNAFINLILKLLENEHNTEDNIPLLKLLLDNHEMTEINITKIISDKNVNNVYGQIWLCLLSNHKSIHENILPTVISEINEIENFEHLIDDSMLSLILNKGLLVPLVNTHMYPKLIQFLLKNMLSENSTDKCLYTVNMCLSDLIKNKLFAEAGALKMAVMGVPHPLRGFTQSIKFMKRNV